MVRVGQRQHLIVKTKPEYWYRQSAAAPVRVVDGRIEVLLVTSLRSGRWILPKGIIEPGMTPAQSAAKEAFEEAGVKGTMVDSSLGTFQTRKWGCLCSVEVFRMDVAKIADQWPESISRRRKWFGLIEALREIHPPGAADVLFKIGLPGLVLTLVHHAKSSRDDSGREDFKRSLNDRGRRDAPEMGRRLQENGVQPECIISSPAGRAIKTARMIAREIGCPETEIFETPEIYEASTNDLLELVRRLPDEKRDVMLVGHNPGLTDFANSVLNAGIKNIPTCGVMRLVFDAQHWRDISPQSAFLLMFDYPKKDTGTT